MNVYKYLFFLVSAFILVNTINAQDRKALEQERMKVIQQIEFTDKLIDNQESDRQQVVNTLFALRAQIEQRNQLLINIKKSIQSTELEIEKNQLALNSLKKKLLVLEKQYHQILRSKYIQRTISSKWITILSSKNINQAFLRWNYYRQFDTYRTSKLEEIKSLQKSIDQSNNEMKTFALENSNLIQEQERQNSQLQDQIAEQNQLILSLQKDKSILESQLLAIRAKREDLNQAIEQKVLSELSGTQKGIIKEVNENPQNSNELTSLNLTLPVTNGFILSLDSDSKMFTDKSLSIRMANDAKVIAIANGKVISVKNVQGYGKMVILQHGSYFSIYANLSNTNVNTGDNIVVNQIIGTITSTEPTLHFELWKDKERVELTKINFQ